jgi:hypothetical protein
MGPRWKGLDKLWSQRRYVFRSLMLLKVLPADMLQGMDMTYAFLRHVYGDDPRLTAVMNGIEYAPHTNADWDPFSVVHKARLALTASFYSC